MSVDERIAAGAVDGDWESADSRPSKTNCTTEGEGPETAEERVDLAAQWWKEKNAIVDRFMEEYPDRSGRPISVRDDVSIREDAARERHDDGWRSQTWTGVLAEFLNWYNGYRHAHLRYRDPDGEVVRAPMRNSHQPAYGDTYYAKLKALERQIVKEYDDLHTAMLTLSGSSKNDHGGWRCPADHLRDVIDSWRPDRGRGVYHDLRDSLSGLDWEYALVVEKHQSGYGHVHVAVFVDGEVSDSDFHGAIDAHLRECPIAGRDAHDYHHPDDEKRPISVNSVDTDLEPEEYNGADDVIGNLGSYLAEYVGAHGEELLDRDLDELMFRSACWATGTQMVRFSNGANELIAREDPADRDDELLDEPKTVPNPEFDADLHATPESEVQPFESVNEDWTLDGVGRVDREGEDRYDLKNGSVRYVDLEDAAHLDPPKRLPPDTPSPRTRDTDLDAFG